MTRSRSSRRVGGLALLVMGVAAVGWFLRDRTSSPDVADRSERPTEASAGGPRLKAPDAAPRDPARGLPPSASAPGRAAPSGATAPAEPVAGPQVFAGAAALLQVSLHLPEAWSRREHAKVYALPAGSAGFDVERDLPCVTVAPGQTEVTLPVPALGAWDVGYACVGLGHVLAADVEVRGPTEVRLDATGSQPLRFRVRASARMTGLVLVRARGGRTCPGRAEHANVVTEVRFDGGDALETPPLEAGVPLALEVWTSGSARVVDGRPGAEWVLSRETAFAGDEVDLTPRPLGLVRNRIQVRPPLPESWVATWPTDPLLQIGARREGEAEASKFVSAYLRKDGRLVPPGARPETEPDAPGSPHVLLLPLAPGTYALTASPWAAWTPAPGPPREIRVRAGETVDVDWTIVPDPAQPPFLTRPADPITTSRFVLRPQSEPRKDWELVTEIERNGVLSWEHARGSWDGVEPLEVDLDEPPRRALLFLAPDRVSEVFVPRSGREVPVPMHPGGTLVVVPENEPHASLGALRLRRTDGLPLPVLANEADRNRGRDDLAAESSPQVRLGSLLGPLPAGRLELEVLLGGVVVHRLQADVRAGVHTPLGIPIGTGAGR